MSPRRLSHHQHRRLDKRHQQRVERARQPRPKPDTEVKLGEAALGPEQEGRVIAHYGTQMSIRGEDGEERRCHLRRHLGDLVTGDRVIWQDGDPSGVVVALGHRTSLVSRYDTRGQLKPLAANVDQLIITLAIAPEPHAQLIDRYLVAAETSGITPVILLNKTDLLDTESAARMDDLLAPYADIGYPLVRASCDQNSGLDALKSRLHGQSSVFVGQSGVGKSSLIQALVPAENLRIGALSRGEAKGTHTTTTAFLYQLPAGGELIDSPGIREFGLGPLDSDSLIAGFREFRPFLGHCRFRDCQHRQEPGCALLQALKDGSISQRRLESYRHLRGSLCQSR